MEKLLLLISLFLCFTFQSIAQQTEDVIHFKNGTVLRGTIIEYDLDKKIRVQIVGGSILVYPAEDIDKIVKEQTKVGRAKVGKKPISYKEKGYAPVIEFGFLIGGNFATSLSGATFRWLNNYRIRPKIDVGLGLGLDTYPNSPPILPIFANVRGDLRPKKVFSPFYLADFGYGFDGGGRWNETARGGLYWSGGLGSKLHFRGTTSWIFSLAYHHQNNFIVRNWGTGSSETKVTFRRVALKVGYAF